MSDSNAPSHRLGTDRSTSPCRIASLLLLVALITACSDSTGLAQADADPGRPVRVAEVTETGRSGSLRLPGVTRAVERAELAFLHPGQLAERPIGLGTPVSAGQTLAVLRNPSLMPGVAAAEARVRELDERIEQLERDTRRLEDLHERGLIATEELERTRAQRNAAREGRDQARAQLEEARDQLEEARLRAPFDGRIVAFHAEPGQFVAAGQPVMSISSERRLEVELALPAGLSRQLEIGTTLTVRQLAHAQAAKATVREIGLAAPGQPARVIIDLEPSDKSLWQPGQPVQVELGWLGETGLSVPLAALLDTGSGISQVFRVNQGRAEAVPVVVGELLHGRVRINGDLSTGDRIVIAGHSQLLDGERVRVLP